MFSYSSLIISIQKKLKSFSIWINYYQSAYEAQKNLCLFERPFKERRMTFSFFECLLSFQRYSSFCSQSVSSSQGTFFPLSLDDASRGLFSVVFAELMGARKRYICPGLQRTLIKPPSKVVDDAYKMHPPCIVCLPTWLEPTVFHTFAWLLSCHLVSPHSNLTWPHVMAQSLGNLGTCSTQSVSTQGRGLFSSRPSVQWIQGKRGLC